jgi:pimeloyl-ACP methyl ester carboxylesterase
VSSSGCASRAQIVHSYAPPCPPRGVVFTVDGAGGYHATSAAIQETIQQSGTPLSVEVFDWSHGCGEVIADQTDLPHICQQGQRLAHQIWTVRQHRPATEIYLVAHSAGSAVALTALQHLPPDSVDRLVLLAPSVSAHYDLRAPLRACRGGIDVFYSERDVGYLWLAVGIVGLADRRWGCAAGRVGFDTCGETPADHALYTRLHQHPWNPSVAWSGHKGGHYGVHHHCFVRAYILPLLARRG